MASPHALPLPGRPAGRRLPVLAEVTLPRARWADVVLVGGAAALTALAAQIVIPVPGSPVPVTGQTFAVLLTGVALGPSRGVLGQLLYVLLGAIGLPVYAGHAGGVDTLVGATGGYLAGFVVAAYLMGALARRGLDRSPLGVLGAFVLGNAAIYLLGVAWLAHVAQQSLPWAVSKGLAPFLLGDLAKAVAAGVLLPAAWWGLRRLDRD